MLSRKRLRLGILVAIAALSMGVAQTASADGWCQCVNYLANRYQLTYYPNASDWSTYLSGRCTANGGMFQQVSTPQPYNVVVYSADRIPPLGHVGLITAVSGTSLTVRGANQIFSPEFTDAGCTNVSEGRFTRKNWGEAYFRYIDPYWIWVATGHVCQ